MVPTLRDVAMTETVPNRIGSLARQAEIMDDMLAVLPEAVRGPARFTCVALGQGWEIERAPPEHASRGWNVMHDKRIVADAEGFGEAVEVVAAQLTASEGPT